MTDARIDGLRRVVTAALDELNALVDADPAASYANRAVRRTGDCLARDWLVPLDDLASAGQLRPPTRGDATPTDTEPSRAQPRS